MRLVRPQVKSWTVRALHATLMTDTLRCHAGEPVSAVFEWLTDCLSDPGCTYELVDPDRKPVGVAAQSMRSAQLVPSALLNFRRLSSAPQQQPTLRQDILRLAK